MSDNQDIILCNQFNEPDEKNEDFYPIFYCNNCQVVYCTYSKTNGRLMSVSINQDIITMYTFNLMISTDISKYYTPKNVIFFSRAQ